MYPFNLQNQIPAIWTGYWVSGKNESIALTPIAKLVILWATCTYNTTSTNFYLNGAPLALGGILTTCTSLNNSGGSISLSSNGATLKFYQYASGTAFVVTSFGET